MVYDTWEAAEARNKIATLEAVCSDINLVLEGKEAHRFVPKYRIELYRDALSYVGFAGMGEFARGWFETPVKGEKIHDGKEPKFEYLTFNFGKTKRKFQKAAIKIGEGKPVDKDLTERVLGVFKKNRGFWRTQLMCYDTQNISQAVLDMVITI